MLNDPTGDPNRYRPLGQYGDLPVARHTHYQNYNALQTLLSRQGTRFSYTVAYTLSKALGIRGDAQGSTTQPPGDIRDSAYGVLGYDRRHVLNIGYSWLLPDVERNAFLNALAGGWQFTGVSTWISGAPLQPLVTNRRELRADRYACERRCDQQCGDHRFAANRGDAGDHLRSDGATSAATRS